MRGQITQEHINWAKDARAELAMLGLSAEDVARKLGISGAYVRVLIQGNYPFNEDTRGYQLINEFLEQNQQSK